MNNPDIMDMISETEKNSPSILEDKKIFYPLSSAQRRLFMLHELDTGRTDYNLVNAVEIEGNISKVEIENIFQKIIDRHEGLRTSFHYIDGKPVQSVHLSFNIKITEINLSDENRSVEQIIYDCNKPFILSRLPLVRIGLINISGSKKILFFITHHIVFDATSMSLVMYEFLSMYKGIIPAPVKLQYKDYAIWENERQKKGDLELQKKYWLDKFSGDLPVLNMPSDFSRTPLLNKQGNKIFFSVDKSVSDGLIKISKDNQATLYIVLLSAFNILLSKYSGQEDIIVGCPSAGRNHIDSLHTVGMFINTLPIRSCPKGQKSFTEFLYEVKNNVLNALSNQEYQFDSLVTELNLKRDMTRNPLFDVMFNLKNSDFEVTNNTDLVFKQYYFKHISVIFDLYLVAEQNTTGLTFRVEYNKSLFLEETIKQLISHFRNIITTIATDPAIQIKSIDILSSDEKDKILFGFNNTKVDYQKEKTITELFEEQVNKTPDNIGIICKDRKLTYKEINQRSNQLARLLRNKGIKPGSFVAIITNRSPEMIIAIISVLKSGGAYLPIDPNYPHDRILFLLKNCESRLILSQKEIIETLHLQNDIICIDLENKSIFSGVDSNPEKINSSDDLAYVIHTSGTTGRPNGVMVKHKPVINLIEWVNKTFKINENDRLLFVTSICFDLSVYDIFGILASGASIQLATDEDIRNPEELVTYLFNNNITFWDSAPTSLQQLVSLFNNYNLNENTRLRLIFLSGDWIPLALPEIIKTTFAGAEVISLGGATEATVWSNFFPINEINPDWKSIPYGKPIQNAKYYIFDSNMNVCPVGVSGDLFIGGDCLSDGYINNEELTSYRYIKNPYSNDPKDIIYRTGDTAKYLHDGNIEFLGRLDNQVKIRGFRIELGEIENALLQEKQISAAVVLAKPNTLGSKDLAAYYISSKEIDISRLRNFLGKSLPDYMIPGYFVHIDSIPMTSNGKVDYKKLLQTEFLSTISSKHFMLPRNPREEKIVEIWKEILNIQQVNLTDNFFYIGGDSIKALKFVNDLLKHNINLRLKDLFENPTIESLSRIISGLDNSQAENKIIIGDFPITQNQKNIFDHYSDNIKGYNVLNLLRCKKRLDINFVKLALTELIGRHDALRIVFKNENGIIKQYNNDINGNLFDLKVLDLTMEENAEDVIINETDKLQLSIDVFKSPLFKLNIFQTKQHDYLAIAVPHLIGDTVSMTILMEDFIYAYKQLENNNQVQFFNKSDSFKKWSEKLYEFANSDRITKEIDYWNDILKYNKDYLPRDYLVNEDKFKDEGSEKFVLSEMETDGLTNLVRDNDKIEMNGVLLCGLGNAIYKWTKEQTILVDIVSHGRYTNVLNLNVTRTIGWLSYSYPVLIDKSDSSNLVEYLHSVNNNIKNVPNDGLGYRVLQSYVRPKEIPFFSEKEKQIIQFNYLGNFEADENYLFEHSNIPVGKTLKDNTERYQVFEVMGIIINNRLNISIKYNKKEFEKNTITSILDNYKNTLIEIAKI